MTAQAVCLSVRPECIPAELVALPRWLVWRDEAGRGKIPYQADCPEKRASSTRAETWASHERAMATYAGGEFNGIGFALDGSGVVGVDIDRCVSAGDINPDALALMTRLNCRYVEFSPSGGGLRGFGYGPCGKGRRGHLGALAVELYSTARYLTVTGNAIHQGPLVALDGWHEISEAIGPFTEETEEIDLVSSVSSASSVNLYPTYCIPHGEGQRNGCLFKMARYLRGKHPHAHVDEMLATVRAWHQRYESVIGTKDFSTSWADFKNSWRNIKQEYGTQLAHALASLPEVPACALRPGYGDKDRRLIQICMALQRHEGIKPFFLSARTAGDLLGISHTSANSLLNALIGDGVLQLVKPGQGYQASRYRVDPFLSTVDAASSPSNG